MKQEELNELNKLFNKVKHEIGELGLHDDSKQMRRNGAVLAAIINETEQEDSISFEEKVRRINMISDKVGEFKNIELEENRTKEELER